MTWSSRCISGVAAAHATMQASSDMLQPEPPRRVLVVVIGGEMGARIQTWREAHDARRAQLLPPHMTLCYRVPQAPLESIEAQVRHAFPRPVIARLGGVTELPN